jgi:uncharacterized membrane protein
VYIGNTDVEGMWVYRQLSTYWTNVEVSGHANGAKPISYTWQSSLKNRSTFAGILVCISYLTCWGFNDSTFSFPLGIKIYHSTIFLSLVLRIYIKQLDENKKRKARTTIIIIATRTTIITIKITKREYENRFQAITVVLYLCTGLSKFHVLLHLKFSAY